MTNGNVTFKPGPTQEAIGPKETAPKRGPGRPPGSSSKSLKSEIASTLMSINLVLIMIPPLRRDQMDMVEIEALADALDDQARKSPRFRKALEGALGVGSGAGLIGIVTIIIGRRAARHGIAPEEMDQMLGNLLATGMQASKKARADAGLG
jgi:hypothetical protein